MREKIEIESENRKTRRRQQFGLEDAPRERVLLRDFLLAQLPKRKLVLRSSSFILEEPRIREYILPQLGNLVLHELRRSIVRKFLDGLDVRHGLSGATINRVHSLLSAYLQIAIEQELIETNPCSGLKRRPENNRAYNWFRTDEEIEEYLAASLSVCPGFYLFASIAVFAGAREGEILAVDPGLVNLVDGSLVIEGTYDKTTRSIRLGTKANWSREAKVSEWGLASTRQ